MGGTRCHDKHKQKRQVRELEYKAKWIKQNKNGGATFFYKQKVAEHGRRV